MLLTAWCSPALADTTPYQRRVLRDPDGAETSLAAAAAGQALVVVVMKGYWCRVCIAQLGRLCQRKPELVALRTSLVGLNADAPATNKRIMEEYAIECPMLSDEKHEVLAELGLWLPREGHALPGIVVFDRCGDEAARWVGRDPDDRPEDELFRVLRKLVDERRVCERPSA